MLKQGKVRHCPDHDELVRLIFYLKGGLAATIGLNLVLIGLFLALRG